MRPLSEKILSSDKNYKIVYLTDDQEIIEDVVIRNELRQEGIILELASGSNIYIPWADLQDRFINTIVQKEDREYANGISHMANNKERLVYLIKNEIETLKIDIKINKDSLALFEEANNEKRD